MKPFNGMKFISQEGTAIVEFVIVLPLLLLIVLGIIDFGIMFYNQQVIANASREGARAGIAYRTDKAPSPPYYYYDISTIQGVVNTYCSHLVTFSASHNPPITTVSGYSASPHFPQYLTVEVDYTYDCLGIQYFLPGFNSPQQIHAETSMLYE